MDSCVGIFCTISFSIVVIISQSLYMWSFESCFTFTVSRPGSCGVHSRWYYALYWLCAAVQVRNIVSFQAVDEVTSDEDEDGWVIVGAAWKRQHPSQPRSMWHRIIGWGINWNVRPLVQSLVWFQFDVRVLTRKLCVYQRGTLTQGFSNAWVCLMFVTSGACYGISETGWTIARLLWVTYYPDLCVQFCYFCSVAIREGY